VAGSGPFSPYRILDLTDSCGQLGPRLLADFGADVVRVEPPEGSLARQEGPYYHDDPRPDRSLAWFFNNANKRGITLDLHTETGRDLLRRLITRFDMLFESFPFEERQELAGLGIGYDALGELNPRLIHVSVTPFGSSGPYAAYKGSDIVAWAMGGKLFLDGDEDRPPVRIGEPQAYNLAGLHAAAGASVALFERGMSGRGQHVDVSAQEAVAWSLMNAAQLWDIGHVNVPRGGALRRQIRPASHPQLYYNEIWPCKDGYVFFRISGGSGRGMNVSMGALVSYMEREGMAGDLAGLDWSQYDQRTMSQEEYDRFAGVFQRFFLTKGKDELFEEAVRSAIQIAPVHDVREIHESPQLAAREYWQKLWHDDLGEMITYPGPPVKSSDDGWALARRAPLVGEHNAEVYAELGLNAADLRALRETGVI
jgi:crotonobetainyl-CoA:carnitine CoA-transferase CaiB-like acyl-CoA transferase